MIWIKYNILSKRIKRIRPIKVQIMFLNEQQKKVLFLSYFLLLSYKHNEWINKI